LSIGHTEFEFAFLGAQDDRLAFHPADHVEGSPRLAAQRHLQQVLLNPRFDGFAQLGLDLEEAVRRTESFDALMGPLVIIVLDPELDAFAGRFEAFELSPGKELLPDGLPEALDLAEGHGMMGSAFEVGDMILLQFGFETGGAPPGGVLPSVVGEHLLGWLELAHGLAINLDDRLRGGTAEQIRRRDEARIIIQERNQISVTATQAESENVTLPHLVGGRPLKEARPGEVAPLGLGSRRHQLRVM